ncbi:MAG: 16S rRNA (adenine(1518)-N(6)/adenine(1519)-N(6))-dimethyltransferase RsmA [Patescibacteria group bacterium]|nr:16S rRNA (adenine(1518)-N(6)/adenine(1519)-N(6))-dimethyltransferase RsmA [Patescibacteria group bacterium]MDD5294974.1 16S rRNA (adenine(1518)-N(6)/adenine(1519)-N(6))-dimethyltransferase RsmA [Patescibacteria group bacterium]MDD5554509.1 16S rRNA (adenine(1518)-N(6)/adenine(1519)-N(6))-dimethyltransferase RsmA [Patescibacteria group bacterium]
MDWLKTTKQLCQLYEIKPARSRGQNFLIKEEVYEKIVKAADLKADDIVLEIGSGLGFLTTRLAKIVKKVVAVELDDKLAEVLQTGLMSQGIKNVEVVNGDILKFRISDFGFRIYKVVANLPYNITSIFLRKFLSAENKPEMMVLMLQKEVAERIVARPPKMSLLAVSVQFYSRPEIIDIVPANCFWPQPEVDSAIIKLAVETNGRSSVQNEEKFFRMVKIGFSAKRKMLKNNLGAGFHITSAEAEKKVKEAGFNPKIRAQELLVEDWVKLFGEFI